MPLPPNRRVVRSCCLPAPAPALLAWLPPSACAPDVLPAVCDLAVMHLHREIAQPDLARAREPMEHAADGGFVEAQAGLGRALACGAFGTPDLERALTWYAVAAANGSADAPVEPGTAYDLGRGRPRSRATAAPWYREAA
jgi:TPR repeat protein